MHGVGPFWGLKGADTAHDTFSDVFDDCVTLYEGEEYLALFNKHVKSY